MKAWWNNRIFSCSNLTLIHNQIKSPDQGSAGRITQQKAYGLLRSALSVICRDAERETQYLLINNGRAPWQLQYIQKRNACHSFLLFSREGKNVENKYK